MRKKKKLKKQILYVAIIFIFLIINISFKFFEPLRGVLKYPFDVLVSKREVDYTLDLDLSLTKDKEYQELYQLTNTTFLSDFTPVYASVIKRDISFWNNTFTINKGSSDGILKNMAVVVNEGLVGKISKVNKYSSEVKLLVSSTYQVSLTINDINCILNSYDSVNEEFLVMGVNLNTEVLVGSKVITSGLGGVFPRGIYVGEVVSVDKNTSLLSQKVKIKSLVDFNNIYYVAVLKGDKDVDT